MRSLVVGILAIASPVLCSVALAAPSEREVANTELGGKPALTLSLLRTRQPDGGLKLRLVVTNKVDKKAKPQSVTVYEGGGDDDGPSDKAFRSASIEPYTLPRGVRGARVDFEFQVPGSKKYRQTDTFLVALGEAPKLVLEATTHREHDRTKVCHELEEATLTLDKDGRMFVRPVSVLESELNDDDLPVDKTCRGKHNGQQITYKFDGETFLQIDPPPAPTKKKPTAEDESDD